MSKFTTYTAQAGILMAQPSAKTCTKGSRNLYVTAFAHTSPLPYLREQLSPFNRELEAKEKRALHTTQSFSSNKPTFSAPTIPTRTTTKEEKRNPTYSDRHKVELSAKGTCFNCEQTGHMAKDYPKKDIKALEANEEPKKKKM